MNTFLRFPDNAGVLNLAHSCDSFFSRVEILQSGNILIFILEVIDDYANLSVLLLDAQVDKSARATGLNLSKGCGNDGNPIGVNFRHLGSRSRSYIPTNDLQGSIQSRKTLSNYTYNKR